MSVSKEALQGTVRCGPVRREPDGRWFYRSMLLGRDDDPDLREGSEIKDHVAWVTLRLAAALEEACDALRESGQLEALHHGLLVLDRFGRWRETRVW